MSENYIKIFDKEYELVIRCGKDYKFYLGINCLLPYLVKNYNILMKPCKVNGRKGFLKVTDKDIQEIFNTKTQKQTAAIIERLRDYNVMKLVYTEEYGYVYAMNPYYFLYGSYVPKAVDDLFRE
jgi:hypothetical protein